MIPPAPIPRRAHVAAVSLIVLVALASVARLLAGQVPYDLAYQDSFRPWRADVAPAALHPDVAAQRPDAADPLDRFRTFWARSLGGDQVLTVWPDHVAAHAQLRQGHLPRWQPLGLGGRPLAAGGTTALFSPLSWPAFLLPLVLGRAVMLFLHLALAGLGLYAFLAQRRYTPAAAATGAVAWMLNPFFAIWLYFGETVPVFALVPLALLAISRLPDAQRPWRPAAALAAITALELLPGNPQSGAYALIAQALLGWPLLGAPGQRGRSLVWLVAGTLVGVLGAAVQLLPFTELASLAYRPPNRYADTNFLPPGALLALPFPTLFGHPARGSWVGGFLFFRPYFSLPGPGTGTLVAGLALVGAAMRRQRVPLALALGVPGLLVALSLAPVHAAARLLVPGFDSLDVLRVLGVFYLALALLAADGVETLGQRAAARAAVAWPALILVAAVALDLGARVCADARLSRHLRHLAHGVLLLSPRVLVPLALAALLALLVRHASHREGVPRWVLLALPLAVSFELLVLSAPTLFSAPRDRVLRATPAVARLRAAVRAHGPVRISGRLESDSFPPYDGDHLPPNTAAALGFDDLRTTSRLPPAPVAELLRAAGNDGFPTLAPHGWADLPLYDLLDVGYVLSDRPPAHFRQVGPSLWENPRPIARAFFTRCTDIVPDAATRVARVVSPAFAPHAQALLDRPVDGAPRCAGDPAPVLLPVRYPAPDRAVIDVTAPGDGVLVLADAWFPGWQARVDGVPRGVLRVDHALRGTLVPAGRHRVDFVYAPESLADGARLSLVAWLVIAAAAWGRRPRVRDEVLLGTLAVVLLGLFLGHDPLPNDNDALYASVIRAVREGGHWIALQCDGVPFLDKPPLFYWLGAAVTAVLGEHAWVLRLPALAGAVAGVLVTARLAQRLTGSRVAGWLAGLLLLTAPTFFEYGRRVYMEVPVALAVLLSFDQGLRERWKRAGLAAGLGFLLKSLPGLLGLAALGVAHLARRRLPRGLLIAAGIALAVLLPWHLAAYAHAPQTFLDFTVNLHLRDQMLSAQPWSTGGPDFYVVSLATRDPLLGVALLLGVAVGLRDWWRTRDFTLGALLVAVGLQLALYTAMATRKPFYLLTLYPLAAVLGARAAAPWLEASPRRQVLALALVLAAFLPQAGDLLRPDLATRPAAYLEPLAQVVRRAGGREPVYTLDTYFATTQFYSRHPAFYAVTQPSVERLLHRIPYLRYGHKVVVWHDDLLVHGAWLVAPAPAARALQERRPQVTVVARNEAFWLLRGAP